MHHRDRMAHAELKAGRNIHAATLHDLYAQRAARQAARERQARLATVYLLPLVLALVVHLTW